MADKGINVDIRAKLIGLMKDPNKLPPKLDSLITAGGNMIVREYKIEAPVDTGNLRSNVQLFKMRPLEAKVTTTATNRGKPYPLFIHGGTLDYRGDERDYGKISRKRMSGKFSFIDAKSGKRGIRPNKFAKRAEETARPKVINLFIREIALMQ